MFFLLLILLLGTMTLANVTRAQDLSGGDLEVESLSDRSVLENAFESKTWHGRNGIMVKQGDTILVANEVRVDEVTRQVVADGMVTLQSGPLYWTGEHLEYNFNTRQIGTGSYRAGVGMLYLEADNLSGSSTNQTYEAERARFTTDDSEHPGYHVRARHVKIEEGKRITARQATLYLGNTPIFYLPRYQRTLGGHDNFWVLTPGYRSTFGPYLLTAYHFNAHEDFDLGLNMDYRAKRGVGVGPSIEYDLKKAGRGRFDYYFAPDEGADNDPRLAGYADERQRLVWAHQAQLATNLTAKAFVNYQRDPLVIRDFFEGEYRTNAQPKTVFEVSQHWENFSLDAVAQPQVNYFFPTVERLPDLKLSALRQQVGVTPVFYEGENSFAYLRNRPGLTGGTNYAAMRANSYHQVVLPKTFFGFLNVTPRVGGRVTHYGETKSASLALDEEDRFVFNTGVETSMKASRVFPGARNDFLEVTELRHIIEPSINYVYVPEPSVRPNQLPQFDTEVPALRLLPVDYPDYNQIDSIDTQNVMRLGMRNKFQTKRDGEIDTLANWFVVGDLRLNRLTGQTRFSDIHSDLDFKPRRWLLLNSQTRFDVDGGRLTFANHSVTLTPTDVWSARVGHWYYRGNTAFGPSSDNNIFYGAFHYRFNENWGARMSHHYEARDGTLEEQYYTLYRDFRSFTGGLTFRARNQRIGPADYTVGFAIQLKSRPTRAGKDRIDPGFLLGN